MTHKPCPTRTIDPDLVRMFLDAQGNKFLSVTFYKTDGTIATRNGQLKATSRLVGNARGAAQGDRMRAAGQVWLAKPDGKSSSFYLGRVVSINAGKASIAVNA